MSFKTTVDVLAQDNAKPVSCLISGGRLHPALAPVFLGGTVPSGLIFVGCANKDNRVFMACNGVDLFVSGNGTTFNNFATFKGYNPFLVRDVDAGVARTLILNGSGAFSCKSRSFTWFSYGGNLTNGIMHCGRLFGSNGGTKVSWSGAGGVRDWSSGINGSGYLILDEARGQILNFIEFGEKLIAVRRFGLTVFNMFGAPENFSVGFTNTDSDKIIKNTAKVVGGKLIFCTASGLKSFDGSVIRRVGHRYEQDIYGPVCAEEFGGKYFLSCESKFLGRKAVLCYDPEDGESYLIDIDSDVMCSADVMRFYNTLGCYALETGGDYSYTSGNINFGSGRNKTVTSMLVDSEGVDIEISNGNITRRFENASGLIRPKLRGKNFTVKVTGKNPVYCLTATAEECNAI